MSLAPFRPYITSSSVLLSVDLYVSQSYEKGLPILIMVFQVCRQLLSLILFAYWRSHLNWKAYESIFSTSPNVWVWLEVWNWATAQFFRFHSSAYSFAFTCAMHSFANCCPLAHSIPQLQISLTIELCNQQCWMSDKNDYRTIDFSEAVLGGATKQLHKRICPSVPPSVRP